MADDAEYMLTLPLCRSRCDDRSGTVMLLARMAVAVADTKP